MAGPAIAPQVILASATLGGVLITAVAGEFRARRQDRLQAKQREEDRAEERRVRFHDERLQAITEVLTQADAFLNRMNDHSDWCNRLYEEALERGHDPEWSEVWDDRRSPGLVAALKAREEFEAAAQRVDVLFSDADLEHHLEQLSGGLTWLIVQKNWERWRSDSASVAQSRNDLRAAARTYFST